MISPASPRFGQVRVWNLEEMIGFHMHQLTSPLSRNFSPTTFSDRITTAHVAQWKQWNGKKFMVLDPVETEDSFRFKIRIEQGETHLVSRSMIRWHSNLLESDDEEAA